MGQRAKCSKVLLNSREIGRIRNQYPSSDQCQSGKVNYKQMNVSLSELYRLYYH